MSWAATVANGVRAAVGSLGGGNLGARLRGNLKIAGYFGRFFFMEFFMFFHVFFGGCCGRVMGHKRN